MKRGVRILAESYLCLDFGINLEFVNRKNTIFSNSLLDQFSNLLEFEDEEFEDFVRLNFLVDDKEIFFSYPNFERVIASTDKGTSFYNNVAIRFPQKDEKNDLVLIGDIFENKRRNRTFNVKAILAVDPNIVHYGELEKQCSTVVKLSRDQNWETSDWSGEYPSDRHNNLTVLNDDFMLQLNGKYVVKDEEDVKSKLEDWDAYLRSRKYLIKTDESNGFYLEECIPEVLIAYNTSGQFNAEGRQVIEPFNQRAGSLWTLDRINEDSRECLLIRLYMEYPKQKYDSEKNLKNNTKKVFDAFIRHPLILGLYPFSQNDKEKGTHIVNLREKSLGPSTYVTIEPVNEIKALEAEETKAVEYLYEKIERESEKEIKKKLESFKESQLPLLTDNFIENERGPVTKRIQTEMNNRLEKERREILKKIDENEKQKEKLLKTPIVTDEKKSKKGSKTDLDSRLGKLDYEIEELKSELSGLETKYDPKKDIELELKRNAETFKIARLSEEKESIEAEVKPVFDKKRKEEERSIKLDFKERKEKVLEEHSMARLYAYFEIEIGDDQDINREMARIQSRLIKGMGLFKDYTGNIAQLKRQGESLNNLLRGEVLNPFMATFLFNPETRGRSVPKHIERFYLESLNESQKSAVEKALSSNGLFLIQGPPGTGKTQVIAEITTQLALSGRKVLIASQNNKAVDNAFSRIPKIPAIRMMRILSENAEKKQNKYAITELLPNFYENLREGLESELARHESRKAYAGEIDRSIDTLSDRLKQIDSLEERAGSISAEISKTETTLRSEYEKRSKVEDERYDLERKVEELDFEISEIKDLGNDQILKKITRKLERKGFDLNGMGDDSKVFGILHSSDSGSIKSEFAKRARHRKYFKLKEEKLTTNDASRISDINRSLSEYCEDNEFEETEEFPILSAFDRIPDDLNVLIESKRIIDEVVEDEISGIEEEKKELKNGMDDTSEINFEINRLKDRIDSLKSDEAYSKLERTRKQFQTEAKTAFTNLHLTDLYDSEEEALEIIEREKRRIEEEFADPDTEERLKAYKKISNYLSLEDVIMSDREAYNHILLKTVNVFGMTCSSKSYFIDENKNNIKINELNIDVVIVDEVSKVPFIEILQPIMYGKTVILVGDHKQLPPIYSTPLNEEEESNYDPNIISMELDEKYKKMYERQYFADLFEKSPESMKSRLTIQYRMHPDIMDVDNVFYGNELEFGGNVADKQHYLVIRGASGRKIITENSHVLFVDVKGQETKESGSTSYTNREEASVVSRLIEMINENCRLDRNGSKMLSSYRSREDTRLSLGVISPYADQARMIYDMSFRKRKKQGLQNFTSFNQNPDEKPMVKTVDDFQGDERDIIILSMVRNRSKFLTDYRRINVAISRARCLLIIVGNKIALEKMKVMLDNKEVPVYRNLIRAIEQKNGVLSERDVIGGA